MPSEQPPAGGEPPPEGRLRISEALAAAARNAGDLQRIPDALCAACVRLLPVSGASVAISGGWGVSVTWCGTHMASVQLVDCSDDTLWLESHCGFPAEFVHHFAVVDGTTSPRGHAARRRQRIVVDDVATAPLFDEPSRAVVLSADCRSCQCTPIPGPTGGPQGMVSTHHAQPFHVYTLDELAALDTAVREAGAWLDRHRTATDRDALEDLHASALRP